MLRWPTWNRSKAPAAYPIRGAMQRHTFRFGLKAVERRVALVAVLYSHSRPFVTHTGARNYRLAPAPLLACWDIHPSGDGRPIAAPTYSHWTSSWLTPRSIR